MKEQKYPLTWKKKDFSIKIFCSIPNIATGILIKAGKANFVVDPGDGTVSYTHLTLPTTPYV